jgi:hypothetical protein
MWLMWGPILRLLPDRAAGDIVKDYYLPDQFAYMGVARNVQEGFPAFVEPFTVTGDSIYPSTYYWALGKVADIGSTTIFGAWNAVGMVVTLGILAMSTAWAVWAAPRTRAWALAPVPMLIGTLEWYAGNDRWFTGYGDHAVLWPAYGSLFSPGAEVFALVAGGFSVLLLLVALTATGRRQIIAAAGSGALLGLALLGHTYVAMFTLTAIVATATAYEWRRRPLGRSHTILVGVLGAVLLASGLRSGSGSLARLGVVLAVPLVWLVLRRDWRREHGLMALAAAAGAIVVGSPLLVRIAAQVADRDSFFYYRQEIAETRDLSLPLGPVLLQFLPLWILAGTAVVLLARRSRSARRDATLVAVVGLVITTLLLAFNATWGFDTEPYRFMPYGALLIGVAAMPSVAAALLAPGPAAAPPRLAAAAVLAACALTIPTTLLFARDTRHLVFTFPPGERLAYERIADVTRDDLAVYDTCFRPDLVKVGGGGRVAYQNIGMAIADHHEAVSLINGAVGAGTLPGDDLLRTVGARWFVSHNHCQGVGRPLLSSRYGAPVRVPPPDVAALPGAPADLVYELYRIDR